MCRPNIDKLYVVKDFAHFLWAFGGTLKTQFPNLTIWPLNRLIKDILHYQDHTPWAVVSLADESPFKELWCNWLHLSFCAIILQQKSDCFELPDFSFTPTCKHIFKCLFSPSNLVAGVVLTLQCYCLQVCRWLVSYSERLFWLCFPCWDSVCSCG